MTDRQDFEAWYEARATDLCTSGHEWSLRDANGHYKDGSVWDHWYIWHTAIAHERAECAKVCEARYMGDNNREDAEAKRCAAAIRARSEA